MNINYKKTIIGIITSLLFCCPIIRSQEKRDSLQMAIYEIHFKSDKLFWKGDRYLVNKSFLSIFLIDNYFQVYPTVPLVSVEIEFGSGAHLGDKNFYPVWLLQDSILYLRDIEFEISKSGILERFPDGKQYRIMEDLTQRKFVADNDSLKVKIPPSCKFGSMRADWVTGIFYVKKIRRWERNEESMEDWIAAPFLKLIFRNGKLISIEEVTPPKL